ncbi:MAG: hypothetical protein ACI8RZ_007948 [Myxococcota bacterium]|jgi:hypothetical protein
MKSLFLLMAMFWSSLSYAGSSWVPAPDDAAWLAQHQAPSPDVPADWISYEGPYATVLASPDDASTALHLSRYLSESLPRIADEMGVPIGRSMKIYVTPDQEAFRSLQPGTPPQWADGTAWPTAGLIYLRSPRIRGGTASPLEQVLDHELAHVLLGQAFGARSVPRWLQEGVAQLVAREYTSAITDRIGQGMFGDNLIPLDELTRGFPADPIRARLAYAQSADLVAFINNQAGPEALGILIREMASGRAFGASLKVATGMTTDELEGAWLSRLDNSMLWLRPLVSDTVILSGAGIAFFILGTATLKRRRQRLAEMAEDEAQEDALYAEMKQWSDVPFHPHRYPRVDHLSAHLSEHGPH